MKSKSNTIEEEKQVPHWGGLLNEFLWTCAGVNKKILLQCPTDWAKYAGTGGLILFTALMAMLSGGYAFFTIFDNTTLAIIFGIFWGLLIFNLDRYIVNTMYSDGEYTISKLEILAGLPRIIIAIFLGIVISTPLELKIYEDEINVKIEEQKKYKMQEYQAADQKIIDSLSVKRDLINSKKMELAERPIDIPPLAHTADQQARDLIEQMSKQKGFLADLQAEQVNIQNQINALTKITDRTDEQETKLSNLTSQRSNVRSRIAPIKSEISRLQGELAKCNKDFKDEMVRQQGDKDSLIAGLTRDIKFIDDEIVRLKEKINNSNYEDVLNSSYGGFQARMSAFSEMKSENRSTRFSALFITLMFIIIEICPTFFKMMVSAGPYDALILAEEQKIQAMSANINDEVNTQIQISVEKNKNKLEAEVAANKELLEKIAVTQAELLKTAVDEWRKQELEKIHQDPSAYIKSNTTQSQS